MLRRLGVLGWPVAHSRSPAMHRAAFAALGLTGEYSYQRLPVPPELFAETTRALAGAGFIGANVTIPHKQAALALADQATHRARSIGAANTLSFVDGRIHAENTDAPGFIAALPFPVRSALVLGAGGSARAVVWALRESGASVRVWNRTPARARSLAAELGVEYAERAAPAELLVNCTTVGLDGSASRSVDAWETLPLTADSLAEYTCVADMVYRAEPTDLLLAARARGASIVDGLEILVRQGALSLELWTGRSAPLEAMRSGAGSE
ncbi:MAG: shikimate dehydrogenase family protein [Solirubrobacteraceae bacterium]